jgi:hypothetical protein
MGKRRKKKKREKQRSSVLELLSVIITKAAELATIGSVLWALYQYFWG